MDDTSTHDFDELLAEVAMFGPTINEMTSH